MIYGLYVPLIASRLFLREEKIPRSRPSCPARPARPQLTRRASSPPNLPDRAVSSIMQLIPEMAIRNITGNFNFTNPGVIANSQILEAYKKHVDPTKEWIVATPEEVAAVTQTGRPNHELDVSKLLAIFPNVPHVLDGVDALMQRVASRRAAQAGSQ